VILVILLLCVMYVCLCCALYSSSKIGCGTFVTVGAKYDNGMAHLEITKMCLDHNHSVSAAAYALHPQNRRPAAEDMQAITELVCIICKQVFGARLFHNLSCGSVDCQNVNGDC